MTQPETHSPFLSINSWRKFDFCSRNRLIMVKKYFC